MKPRVCNYCGQTLPEFRLGVRLPPVKARLFDLIQRGGEDGVDKRDLRDILEMGIDGLKSHIHQINELIGDTGYRIVGHSIARLSRIGAPSKTRVSLRRVSLKAKS